MNFDEEEVHPAAARLLTSESRVLWEMEVGPLNSDRGHDAAMEFREWRAEHPDRPASSVLSSIVEGWDVRYRPELADDATIRAQITAGEDGELDVYDEVFVRDETIIATFLAQILDEGHIDGHARGMVRIALKRQAHPLVLERFFPDAADRDTRRRAILEASRLVEAAADAKPPARAGKPRTPRRRAKNEPGPCPWPVGSVLSYRLPSSKTILLLHFAAAGTSPWFYVLDWIGDAVPSAEIVRALDIKPSKNMWKFCLVLPTVDALELPSGYQARLEQVLRPTGVTMSSHRDPTGTLVFWQNLAEYLATTYDFDAP